MKVVTKTSERWGVQRMDLGEETEVRATSRFAVLPVFGSVSRARPSHTRYLHFRVASLSWTELTACCSLLAGYVCTHSYTTLSTYKTIQSQIQFQTSFSIIILSWARLLALTREHVYIYEVFMDFVHSHRANQITGPCELRV